MCPKIISANKKICSNIILQYLLAAVMHELKARPTLPGEAANVAEAVISHH